MVSGHIPVLHTTVLRVLRPNPGDIVLDVTVGLAGHAQSFLEAIGPTGRLIGLDADPLNLDAARERLQGRGVIDLRHANFRDLTMLSLPPVDVLFADLGLSSPHLDDPMRGFTFRTDAALDLRFDQSSGRSAQEFIAESDGDELFHVFRTYGEFPGGARLARALAGKDVATTLALKQVVEEALGYRAKTLLPQVFQALRIAVNDELTALKVLLEDGLSSLKPAARIGIISYHSLEDRLVKSAFRKLSAPERDPVTGTVVSPAPFTLLTRKAIVPDAEEVKVNPRARSAKFRAIIRH